MQLSEQLCQFLKVVGHTDAPKRWAEGSLQSSGCVCKCERSIQHLVTRPNATVAVIATHINLRLDTNVAVECFGQLFFKLLNRRRVFKHVKNAHLHTEIK